MTLPGPAQLPRSTLRPELPAAAQHPLASDAPALHGTRPPAEVATLRRACASVTTPPLRRPTQHHTCRTRTGTATLFCGGSTSEYQVATLDPDRRAVLDTPQAATTGTTAHLRVPPDCVVSRLHSRALECTGRHSPAHSGRLLSAEVNPAPNARGPEEDQGESVLPPDGPEESLGPWTQQPHGGLSLHVGAGRARTGAGRPLPGHQPPPRLPQDHVSSRAVCQRQRQRVAPALQAPVRAPD